MTWKSGKYIQHVQPNIQDYSNKIQRQSHIGDIFLEASERPGSDAVVFKRSAHIMRKDMFAYGLFSFLMIYVKHAHQNGFRHIDLHSSDTDAVMLAVVISRAIGDIKLWVKLGTGALLR